MNEIFQKTRELGDAILRSDAYQKMKALEEVAMRNVEAACSMEEYVSKKREIEDLLIQENPDVDRLRSLSDDLDNLKQKMSLIVDMQALTEARAQFTDLINEVNNVLRFIITGEMADEEDGCEGGCDTCPGCGHLH